MVDVPGGDDGNDWGVPELRVPDYSDQTTELPTSVDEMTPAQLGEWLQFFGAMSAFMSATLGKLRGDAKWHGAILDQKWEAALSEARRKKEENKGITKDALKAEILEASEELTALYTMALKAETAVIRADGLYDAYKMMRDTLSRQVEIKRMEWEASTTRRGVIT